MGLLQLKINNSKKHAVGGKKWKDPGAKLYDQCLNAFYSDGDVPCGTKQLEQAMRDGSYKQWPDFLKEAYLVAPVNGIKNSPYGVTPFSRSGCKYPHHVIRNGQMVLSIPGVKRAWDMTFYQKSMTPEVKRHLNRHMKELGIEPFFHHGQLYWNESKEIEMKIEDNFLFIENCIKEGIGIDLYCSTDIDDSFDTIYEKSHGDLKYEYRIGVDINTGRLTSIQFKLDPSKINSVGHQDGYEVAHIMRDKEFYRQFTNVMDKIDDLKSNGKNDEAKELENRLDDKMNRVTSPAKSKALEFVKDNVKKLGHIDYISDESVVDKIFHKDGGSINSVSIIPVLSKDLFKFINYLDDNYDMNDFKVKSPYSYKGTDDGVSFSYTQLFGASQVRELFVKFCKDNNLQGEKYEVGKLAGKNKYRSTKIMWDASWLYQKYSRSPVLRGNLSPVQINTNKSTYDGMNKPKIRTENTDQIQLSNDLNSEDYIRPLNKNDVRKEHFIGWFFKMNEFVNDDPTTFDLDLLVNNGYIKNYVFGYFIDNNLEGIIKIRYNISINTYAVSMLFVNEDKQHAGIGDALMKHAVSLFGDHDMTLRVFALNTHALSLYKKYDFQVTKTEVYEDGPDADERFVGQEMYLMKRDAVIDITDNTDSMLNESTSNPDPVKKKSTKYVPIYGIVKSYSKSALRNDGSEKSSSKMKSVKFHKWIGALTRHDNYSHALVSFDDSLTKMYSYEDDGFVEDNIIKEDSWMGTESIYICVMFVNKEDKVRMQKFVKDLKDHAHESAYASANLLKAYIGTPYKIDKRFVCSSFTGYIMSCSNPKNLHRDYSRLRPEDITILPRSFYVMNVRDREDFIEKQPELKSKVAKIFEEFREEIDDYNNHLPKLLLKDRCDKLKTIDKIFDWIIDRL